MKVHTVMLLSIHSLSDSTDRILPILSFCPSLSDKLKRSRRDRAVYAEVIMLLTNGCISEFTGGTWNLSISSIILATRDLRGLTWYSKCDNAFNHSDISGVISVCCQSVISGVTQRQRVVFFCPPVLLEIPPPAQRFVV